MVRQPNVGAASSCSQEALLPMSVQGREQAEPLKTGTHLSWWREAGHPAQGDVLSQRNSDVGGTWREVQTSGQMKHVLF